MSNIGYILCHVLALSGFLLLRKDRPNWPRPVKVAAPWVFMAGVLGVFNLVILVVGAGAPKLNGYGTWTDFGIGVGILVRLGTAVLLPPAGPGQGGGHWTRTAPRSRMRPRCRP